MDVQNKHNQGQCAGLYDMKEAVRTFYAYQAQRLICGERLGPAESRTPIILDDACASNATVTRALERGMEDSSFACHVFTADPAATSLKFSVFGYYPLSTKTLVACPIESLIQSTNVSEKFSVRSAGLSKTVRFNVLESDESLVCRQGRKQDIQVCHFIAEKDRQIAGRAQAILGANGTAYLSHVYTEERFRRQGCGKALMAAIGRVAQAEGIQTLVLIPSPMATMIYYYPKFGFQPVMSIIQLERSDRLSAGNHTPWTRCLSI